MSMRVAIFTDNDFAKTNGVTTTLRALLRHAPGDVQPRIYTCAERPWDDLEYFAQRSPGIGIPFYREMRMYLPRLAGFRRALAADGVQVLHLTTPGPVGLAARWLARETGLPLVGSFHTQLAEYTTTLSGSPWLGRRMGDYLRWLYGSCSRVLVPSEDTRARLARDGWHASRLALWTRGVDVDTFSPDRRSAGLRERWEVSDRRPAILYAGRLSREKGLALVEPLARLLAQHGVRHRLVFVGDGPMAGELQARFPDAVFTGTLPHADVAAAMASADLFLFPSETDTAGNVVLEAQACGLPVLVADAGGPRENLEPDVSGYVCRSGDETSFCRRATELLSDARRRAAMAQAARRYACSRSWSASLAPVYAAYRAAARPPAVPADAIHPKRRAAAAERA